MYPFEPPFPFADTEQDTTRRRFSRYRFGGAVVGVVVVLAFVASIGGGSKVANGPDSKLSSGSPGAVVDDAGASGVASSGEVEAPSSAYGRRSQPIPWDRVTASSSLGTAVTLSITSSNLCREHDISTYWTSFNRNGTEGRYYRAYIGEIDWKNEPSMAVVCSYDFTDVWAQSIGPGRDGVSVSCPAQFPRAVPGTGQAYMMDARTHQSIGNMTQAAGGYGTNSDGLWNMKFTNWNLKESVQVTVWLLCQK